MSEQSVAPGGSLTVSGGGFLAGERVSIELHSTPVVLGLSTASADGSVTSRVTIPQDATAGEHRIVLRGLESGRVISQDIVVTKASTPAAPALVTTGGESLAGLAVAGSLLALGGSALLFRTLRTNRKAS